MSSSASQAIKPERSGSSAAAWLTSTAEPPAKKPSTTHDAPPKRRWWKKPAGVAAVACVLAATGVGGYVGVHALLTHPSTQAKPRGLAQVRGLPPGAAECQPIYKDVHVPFNAGARGTPMTSCAFVEQVRRAYWQQNPPSPGTVHLRVPSPVTEKWYNLTCVAKVDYATCTGGAAAIIYLYNR